MNKLEVNSPELLNMLKTTEGHFPSKKDHVLMVDNSSKKKKRPKVSSQKNKSKKVEGKAKMKDQNKPDPASKEIFFHCNKSSH